MKHVIVEYKKLNDKILNLLSIKFPYGYGDEDIITFKNSHGEHIEAVEVRTEDTVYLVKIGKKLQAAIKDFDEDLFVDEEEDLDAENNTDVDIELEGVTDDEDSLDND